MGFMRHWSRNDKFAFFGVILAAIGVAAAVFPQEIRRMAGLDGGPASAQSSAIAAPSQKSAPADGNVLAIESEGDSDVITILPARTKAEASIGPVSLSGDSQVNTYYLWRDQHATVSIKGDSDVLRIAPNIKSRVQVLKMDGDGDTTQDAKEK